MLCISPHSQPRPPPATRVMHTKEYVGLPRPIHVKKPATHSNLAGKINTGLSGCTGSQRLHYFGHQIMSPPPLLLPKMIVSSIFDHFIILLPIFSPSWRNTWVLLCILYILYLSPFILFLSLFIPFPSLFIPPPQITKADISSGTWGRGLFSQKHLYKPPPPPPTLL